MRDDASTLDALRRVIAAEERRLLTARSLRGRLRHQFHLAMCREAVRQLTDKGRGRHTEA